MAFERRNSRDRERESENTDPENVYGFSRSVKGFNVREVNEFIANLMKSNKNAIKNYESKISDYKDNSDIMACELEELKEIANKHQQNVKSAIASADDARAKLRAMQKEIERTQELCEQNEKLEALVKTLTVERDAARRDAMRAEVDKKHAKEKLESAKAELSDTKNQLKAALEAKAAAPAEPAPAPQPEAAPSPASQSNNDAELEKMVGAYTVHLRKTRQIVDSLVEQLNKANDIF